MSMEKFHKCLNPENEKMYVPTGQLTGEEPNLDEIKKIFKKPQITQWQKKDNRLNGEELTKYLAQQQEKNIPTLIGFAIPEDLIVIDVDLMYTAEILTNMLNSLGIRHCRLKTNAGKHFIFKKPPTFIKTKTAAVATPAGFMVDCLTPKTTFIMLPFAPTNIPSMANYKAVTDYRCVEHLIPKDQLSELPLWLVYDKSLGVGKRRKIYAGLPEEEIKKRMQDSILPIPLITGIKTDNLQRWMHNMAHSGYSVPDIEFTIKLINKYICMPPINDLTLNNEILNKRNIGRAAEEVEHASKPTNPEALQGGKFVVSHFGNYMKKKYHIISIEGRLGLYNDGVYELNEDLVMHKMYRELPTLDKRYIQETIFYLQKFYYSGYVENANPYEVVVQNGILDLKTGTLQRFTPEKVNLNKLKVAYKDFSDIIRLPQEQKPEYVQLMDKFLGDITKPAPKAAHDMGLVMLIMQMAGYVLWKSATLKKAFILFGRGDNGKSVLISIIHSVIGGHNSTSLEFNDFTSQDFKVANLKRKLACITGDISKSKIKETNIFKAVVSGDPISAGEKKVQPKDFTPYATIIMSANEIPPTSDTSKAFFDRLIIIPFDRDFPNEGTEDKTLKDKLLKAECLEYFLYLAVQASVILYNTGKFNITKRNERMIEGYKMQHNTVLKWLLTNGVTIEQLAERKPLDTYTEYSSFCLFNNLGIVGKNKFYTLVENHFSILVRKRHNSGTEHIWRIVKL